MLTKQQRDRLRESLRPMIREEINRATGALDDDRPSYANKILSNPENVGNPPAQARQRSTPAGIRALSNVLLAMASGGNRLAALAYARDRNMDDAVLKVLSAGDADAGGVFVPSELAADFIDLLRPRSVVRAANPQTVDNIAGTFTFPKLTAGVTPNWVGETTKRPTKQQKTGSVTLTPKWLSVQTPVSIFLQRASTQTNLEQFVRDDLIRGAATEEDIALLQGTGSEFQPKGLLNWAASGNKFNANATVTTANTIADLRTARGKLANADVPADRRWWFMREEVLHFLQESRDNGQLVFPETLEAQPMLRSSPVGITNNIPNDLGGGSDETRIYYAAMDEVILGEVQGVIIRATDSGQFVDPVDSQTKDAFTHGVMLLQVLLGVDLIVRHAESVAVIEAVTWHNA